MPFGLYNTLASLKILREKVFGKYLCKFVMVFFDYILIYRRIIIDLDLSENEMNIEV